MNPTEAPLHVPVEIRLQGEQAAAQAPRWFRLATAISPERVRLRSPLPADLCGARVEIRLRLPPLPGPADPDAPRPVLALRAIVVDSRDEDQDEADEPRPRRLDLPAPGEADRAAITRYVERRLA
jgi:hypothetical protein